MCADAHALETQCDIKRKRAKARESETNTCCSNGKGIREDLNHIKTQLLLAHYVPCPQIELIELVAYVLVVRDILPVSSVTHTRDEISGRSISSSQYYTTCKHGSGKQSEEL